MNKIKSLFVAIGLLLSTSVSAYDFEVDGLQYDVVSLSDLTCKLVGCEKGFEGDFVIPAHVNYSNKTLTVVEIKKGSFYGCSNLTGITIPNTILSIGDDVFNRCTKLKDIIIEDGENELEFGHKIIGYDGNTTLVDALFTDCPIKSLYLGRNISCGIAAPFSSCNTLTEVNIGNLVTRIGYGEFESCPSLTNITIPNSVTKIGFEAFEGCSSLTSISIPNSVTEIDSSTFGFCIGLTSVTIGDSVEKIEEKAFYRCDALTELYSLNATPPTIESSNTFDNNHYMTLKVYVPKGSLNAYQEAEGWKDFWNLAEGAPTGINQITTDNDAPSTIYDLQGNKLTSPKRGINVINGKKIVVK